MSMTNNAFVYTDLQALAPLRKAARDQSPDALREAAKQFEAVFTQMMLKGMRSASLGDGGLLNSDQVMFYRDLADQQLALTMAKHGRLGLADMMVRQLGGEGETPRPKSPSNIGDPLSFLHTVKHIRYRDMATTPSDSMSAAVSTDRAFQPGSPEAFVRGVWNHAQNASRQLGVAPEVLIAQAALETGWGKSVPRFADGRSSHNLFGIKADSGWSGERVVNSTLEYEGGLPVLRRDGFRAYPSYAESFTDYVRFLRDNPRYSEALKMRGDSAAYLRALQRAGYATDPGYAEKILSILGGPVFDGGLEGLKPTVNGSIIPSKG